MEKTCPHIVHTLMKKVEDLTDQEKETLNEIWRRSQGKYGSRKKLFDLGGEGKHNLTQLSLFEWTA